MIIDALWVFDSNVDLAIAAGDQDSTNIVDVGVIDGIPTPANGGGGRDMGVGDKPALKLSVLVSELFASAGSTGTVQCAIKGAPDNGAGAPGTFVTLATGPAFVIPSVGENLMPMDLPRTNNGVLIRFYKLTYSIAVQTMTAGKVSAQVVLDDLEQPQGATGRLSGYRAGLNVAN